MGVHVALERWRLGGLKSDLGFGDFSDRCQLAASDSLGIKFYQ